MEDLTHVYSETTVILCRKIPRFLLKIKRANKWILQRLQATMWLHKSTMLLCFNNENEIIKIILLIAVTPKHKPWGKNCNQWGKHVYCVSFDITLKEITFSKHGDIPAHGLEDSDFLKSLLCFYTHAHVSMLTLRGQKRASALPELVACTGFGFLQCMSCTVLDFRDFPRSSWGNLGIHSLKHPS